MYEHVILYCNIHYIYNTHYTLTPHCDPSELVFTPESRILEVQSFAYEKTVGQSIYIMLYDMWLSSTFSMYTSYAIIYLGT
jgi:hypothetical protein